MITHEEARQYAFGILPQQIGSKSSRRKLDNYFKLDLYFRQQKKKDERAKKVEELLDLYRLQHEFKERYNTSVRLLDQQECLDTIREIAEEIYLKEKELESEMK